MPKKLHPARYHRTKPTNAVVSRRAEHVSRFMQAKAPAAAPIAEPIPPAGIVMPVPECILDTPPAEPITAPPMASSADIAPETIARARRVRIEDEACKRTHLSGRRILVGPCPQCGGPDKLFVSVTEQHFKCRGGGEGDVVALVQHVDRTDFATAVMRLTGTDVTSLRGPRLPDRFRCVLASSERGDVQTRRVSTWASAFEQARQLLNEAQGRDWNRGEVISVRVEPVVE
jgi:hypothetical protein